MPLRHIVPNYLLAHLKDPEFCDVTIIANDGEISANKAILSMRSEYFRSMLSSNNNFNEGENNTVKVPFSKALLEKVIIFMYSGQLDYEEMELRHLLDLLDLLNLMNLPKEFSEVEDFTIAYILGGEFPLSDCLKYLDDSSKLGFKLVGETLLSHLGCYFEDFCQTEEVGILSETMIILLLEEMNEDSSQTIFRFRTFVTWLSLNSMDTDIKEEVLQMFNFQDFTFKDLSSDVRKSGLYPTDKIFKGFEELGSLKEKEVEKMKNEKSDKEKSARDFHNDMQVVKNYIGNKWYCIPREIRRKYNIY